jgi:broad specificity phosphatase PhoE
VARLYLIRHVEVELREDVAPEEWRPTVAGLEAARRLAAEPFARDEADLREVRRTNQGVLPRDEYVALVGRYLGGKPVDGWERADEARRRFSAALERVAAAADGPAAVVTHGLVISLRLGYGLEEWRDLRLPDVVETDV